MKKLRTHGREHLSTGLAEFSHCRDIGPPRGPTSEEKGTSR